MAFGGSVLQSGKRCDMGSRKQRRPCLQQWVVDLVRSARTIYALGPARQSTGRVDLCNMEDIAQPQSLGEVINYLQAAAQAILAPLAPA